MHEDQAIVESLAAVGELPAGLILCQDLPGRIGQWRVIHGPGKGSFFNMPHNEVMDSLRQHGGVNGLLAHHFPASPTGTFAIDGNGGQCHIILSNPLPFYGLFDGQTVGTHKGRFWTRFPLKTPNDPTGENFNVVLRLEEDALNVALCSGMPTLSRHFTICKRQAVTFDLDAPAGRLPELIARYEDHPSLRWRVIRHFFKEILPGIDCPIGFRLRGPNAAFRTTTISVAQFDQLATDAWILKRDEQTEKNATFYTATELGDLDTLDPDLIGRHLVHTHGRATNALRILWTGLLIGARPEGYGIPPDAVYEYSTAGGDGRGWMHPGQIWKAKDILRTPAARQVFFEEPSAHEEIAALPRLTEFFASAPFPGDLRETCLAILEG